MHGPLNIKQNFIFIVMLKNVFAAKDALPAVINAVHYVHFLVSV